MLNSRAEGVCGHSSREPGFMKEIGLLQLRGRQRSVARMICEVTSCFSWFPNSRTKLSPLL